MNTFMTYSLPMLLLGSLIKTTFLLLTAWTACQLLQRAAAATRHLVWVAALVGVLLMPILSLSLPQWKVAWSHVSASATIKPMAAPQAPHLPLAPTDASAASQVAPPSAPVSDASKSLPAVTPVSRAVPVPTSGHQFSPLTYALGIGLLVWLIGLLAVLCQLYVGLSRLVRIERHSIPLEHRELQVAENVRGRMGLHRPVRFLRATEATAITVPVTWGILRPVVLLPAHSNAWSEDCLRAALLHELAHVQRGDWATQITARLAYALYWWHPLVWWAARRAREESERACDDLVLGTGMKAADYAQRLIEVVRSMPEGIPTRTVAVAMAQPSEVEGRVQAVLALGSNRHPLTRRRAIGNCTIIMLLILPLAALRLTPSAQAHGAFQRDAMSTIRVISPFLSGTEAGVPPANSDIVAVADGHVVVTNGDRAVFPNGYEVSLIAVTQAVRTGDEWDMFGGPWWRRDGMLIAPQTGGLDGHWHWSVAHTDSLPPFVFKVAFRAPASTWKHGESNSPGFFEQFLGALKPNDQTFAGHFVSNGPHPTVRDMVVVQA